MKYLNLKKLSPDWLPVIFLAILAVIFLWRVVFLGQVLMPIDVIYKQEPWKSEAFELQEKTIWNPTVTDQLWGIYPYAVYGEEIHKGGSIFWDPYLMGGLPALARGEILSNPIFHFFLLLFPAARALSGMAVLNLFLAGFFTFLLLREMKVGNFGAIIGALAYSYNGYLVGWLSLTHIISTMVWLPLVFWGIERALARRDWRWTIAGAAAFVFYVLSGSALFVLFGAFCVIIIGFYRAIIAYLEERNWLSAFRPIFYTGLTLGLGTLIVSPQLLLTVQLFLQSVRTEPLGATSGLDLKTHLLRLLIPSLFGNGIFLNKYNGAFNFSETSLYFGIIPLLLGPLALVGRNRKLAWGFFLIGFFGLFAVYNLWPFRQLVSLIFPFFVSSFPGRIFHIVAFTGAIVTGFGADALAKNDIARAARFLAITAFILIVAILTYWKILVPAAGLQERIYVSGILTAVAILVGALIIFVLWDLKILKPTFLSLAIVLVVVFDLFITGVNYNAAFDPKLVFPKTDSLQFIDTLSQKEGQPYRVLNVNSGLILLGNTPEIYQMQTISGYSSWVLKRSAEYAYLTEERFKDPVHVYYLDCCSRLLDALNIKYVYTAHGTTPSSLGVLSLIQNLDQAEIERGLQGSVTGIDWKINRQTQKVLYQHPPSKISFEIPLHSSVTFKSAIVVDKNAWDKPGDGVQFAVAVSRIGEVTEETLFSHYIDPKKNQSDQTPVPVEIDLSAYEGQTIRLSLSTSSGPSENSEFDWAGWVDPVLLNYSDTSLTSVYEGPNSIYLNREAFPRAWVVHQVLKVATDDFDAVKHGLSDKSFNLAREAVVEVETNQEEVVRFGPIDREFSEKVDITDYATDRVSIIADLDNPGLLVLADAYYPGWRVYVDGEQQTVIPTNLTMRGVFLDEGEHTVEFVYHPDPFYIGLVISSLTIAAILLAIWISPKIRAKFSRPSAIP